MPADNGSPLVADPEPGRSGAVIDWCTATWCCPRQAVGGPRHEKAAETLDDARIPPGNRLEKLRGDRAGQYSIRVNQQWRICFRWTAAGPEDIEITDYH